ncbi:peptidase family M48-domain-containing protein [Epithele typhae]|uniref:peptidase family M48-domain-containing protein n=1 Tax=Epithele typhae TaxID=378194 RepID=UPI002007EE87|nr:peptidase family M48-domain-containing protein [Epithele typhae]KAH9933994.1 peptidase family M48-domain-containing protein [Epithele typhae]
MASQLAWVSTESFGWKLYLQAFSWAIFRLELSLHGLRQYLLYSKIEPPPALAEHFKPETFKKSQEYGKDKAKFSLISGLLKQVVDSVFIQLNLVAWCWTASGWVVNKLGYGPEYEISQSIAFAFALSFISSLLSLPFSLYQTFVLEEKHGFNKTAPSLFDTDPLKSWLVGFAIGAYFLAVFLSLFKWAGDRFVPWLMAFLFVFQMSMLVLYPTVIHPLFNKLSPLAGGDVRGRIEALASKLKFPLEHLYEIAGSNPERSSHSSAYFFGLPWSKHIVISDTLAKHSKAEEVEAVLAHELGHWYHAHPTKLLLLSLAHVFTVLALFPAFLHAPPLLAAFGFPAAVAARPPIVVASRLYRMLLTPTEAVLRIAVNALSRRFEYEADRFACELQTTLAGEAKTADVGDCLGRALVALDVEDLCTTVWVDWLYSAYHHPHPTLMERLRALDGYKSAAAAAYTAAQEKAV